LTTSLFVNDAMGSSALPGASNVGVCATGSKSMLTGIGAMGGGGAAVSWYCYSVLKIDIGQADSYRIDCNSLKRT
jgi:hypothetical protein